MAYGVSFMGMGGGASFGVEAGFPLTQTVNPAASTASVQFTGVNTAAASTMFVSVVWEDTSVTPTTVSGGGLAWSKIANTSTGIGGRTAEIWRATSAGPLSSQTITITPASTSNSMMQACLYSVTGAGATGVSGVIENWTVTTGSLEIALSGTTAGSLILGAFLTGASSTTTVNGITTRDATTYYGSWGNENSIVRATGAAGSTTIGMSTSVAYRWGAAVEILPA